MITIRKAKVKDVLQVQQLIEPFAQEGRMLTRPIYEIYDAIRDYFVAIVNSKIVGCCALHIFGKEYNPKNNKEEEIILAEVRALAVIKKWQGKKIGTKLIRKCLKEAKELAINKIFVLTLEENLIFFKKLGFKRSARNSFPQKIWQECVKCPRFPSTCNEIPLILEL